MSSHGIPIVDFRRTSGVPLEEGTEEWRELSKKVVEAFANHGCLVLVCDEMSNELRKDFFAGMKSLFDLPEETKQKFTSTRLFRGYASRSSNLPNAQSFGIDTDGDIEKTQQNFINILWPEGNPKFSEALKSMTSNAHKLSSIIMKMVVDGFNLPEKWKSDIEDLYINNDLRLTRYQSFEHPDSDTKIGGIPHTDKRTLAIICDNEVQGLQVSSESGDWVDVSIPPNAFVVMGGDALKAWSNGRLEARAHRVLATPDKERFSFVLFSVQRDGILIQPAAELVDEEHPLRYRPYKPDDYLKYLYETGEKEDTLRKFAGV